MRRTHWFLLVIIALALGLRLYGITNPFTDFHGWRQCDTASIARNFYELQYNILYPQLNYNGAPPNYAELELQVVPFITATLYFFTGVHEGVGRSVVIAFSLLSLIFIYLLGRKLGGKEVGVVAAFFMAVLPFYLYFSRNFQPDVAMVTMMVAWVYFFLRYLDEGSPSFWFLAWLTGALTLLIKLPGGLTGLALAFEAARRGRLKDLKLYSMAILTLLPTFLYYRYVHAIAEHPFVTSLASSFLGQVGVNLVHSDFYRYLGEGLFFYVVPPPAFFLAIIGLWAARNQPFLYVWTFSLGLGALVVGPQVLKLLQYYFLPFVPLVALFTAYGVIALGRGWRQALGTIFILCTLLLTLWLTANFERFIHGSEIYGHRWYQWERWLQWDRVPYKAGQGVEKVTPEKALVITGEETPRTLYYCHRFGWFQPPSELTPEILENYRQEGAGFLVLLTREEAPELGDYLTRKMEQVVEDPDFLIYRFKQ